MHVTTEWLREANTAAGAAPTRRCDDWLAMFEAEWPDGVEVSRESIACALELGLNVGWFISLWKPGRYAACCEAVKDMKDVRPRPTARMARAIMQVLADA